MNFWVNDYKELNKILLHIKKLDNLLFPAEVNTENINDFFENFSKKDKTESKKVIDELSKITYSFRDLKNFNTAKTDLDCYRILRQHRIYIDKK